MFFARKIDVLVRKAHVSTLWRPGGMLVLQKNQRKRGVAMTVRLPPSRNGGALWLPLDIA